MSTPALSPTLPPCPDAATRAPLASREGRTPHARLHLAPPALQGALVAIACRDTRGFVLSDAQRLSHFPASPLVCLSWFVEHEAGLVECDNDGRLWRPFGSPIVISGSQSRPTTSWAPATRALFGLDLAAVHDRFIDARTLLGDTWQPLLAALLDADNDAAALAALERHLAPRWLALQGGASALSSLRQAGRHWVGRLALQARQWGNTHSPRQVERRIKAFSGRSLREWQALVRTESVFFRARERLDAGEPFDWATLALDEGFADQAHLSRAVKRIAGFAPREFALRFAEDESFWMYRLWV
jgi:AraC-like DNA-binding protein